MRFLVFLWSFLLITGAALSQSGRNIPVGSWRQHNAFINPLGVEKMGGIFYIATPNGIFSYDPETGEYGILDKVTGLSSVGITAFRKHPGRDMLMVGYDNGVIDIIEKNKVTPLRDIENSRQFNDKSINSIRMSGNLAYVSTNFGVVVFNIAKREVRDFNTALGATGNTIRVQDCLQFKDSVFALTTEGLKNISRRDDFRNTNRWRLLSQSSPALPNRIPLDIELIDSLNGNFYLGFNFGYSVKTEGQTGAYRLALGIGGIKRAIHFFDNRFYVLLTDNILVFNQDFSVSFDTLSRFFENKIGLPLDLEVYENQKIICDGFNGMIVLDQNNNLVKRLSPNNLFFAGSFSLGQYKDRIILNSGGYTLPSAGQAAGNRSGFAVFRDNEWKTYSPRIFVRKRPESVQDIVHSFFNPATQKLYQTSFGCGILEYDAENLDTFNLINDVSTGGGLCNIFFNCVYNYENLCDRYDQCDPSKVERDPFFLRMPFTTIDFNGDIWAGNYEVGSGALRVRSAATGQWRSIVLPFSNGIFPLDLKIDQNGYKWVRMAPLRENGNAGAWVLNNDGSRRYALTSNEKQGNLPSNDVYDIQEDKSGYIWLGTGKGLCVYYNPLNAFAPGGISASTPIFPPEAGRPVLENEVVTTIEIDGANRKWVGTKNNGIWLFNQDITKLIAHFTEDNSPLISNNILDLAINKPTGELFIATDKGLISYQTDASENIDPQGFAAADDCSFRGVNLFPNPVNKGYDGLIAVNGLASNSIVKFVTASGKLVYETNAKGGMATWNGITYDGKKANPGIYLVLASSEDGKSNCVSKLAILD